MSEGTSTAIDMPEDDHHQDGDQADQAQHLQHSNEPDTTDQPTDTSITVNESTPADNNSLEQQNDQERPESPSPATSTLNRVPLILEKALLIDISADAKWVASLVERSEESEASKQYYLKINKLYDDESYTLDGSGNSTEENITKCIPTDMKSYFYFLSVSPNGSRVAISFLPAKEFSSESPKLDLDLPSAPKCFIFQVLFQKDRVAKIEPEETKIKVQGKATFISDNLLSVINGSRIMVYDINRAYKLERWYDAVTLFYSEHSKLLLVSLSWSNTHLLERTSSVNKHQADRRPLNQLLAAAYLQLTEFMEDYVMVSTHDKNVIRVWSLRNGCRLSSFQTLTPEVPLALSDDNNFIATFSKSASLVNIYHIKTGLVSNTLRTTLGDDLCSKRHLNHQMVHAKFCNSGKLLFLIQVRPLKLNVDSNNALITFEGWDIAAEKQIVKQTVDIRVNWKSKNSYVKPCIVERDEDNWPFYTALYTALMGDDSCEFRSLDLDVFKRRNATGEEGTFTYNWIPLSISEAQHEKEDSNDELIDNLNDFSKVTCFRLKENPNVVMRIGRHTVQLWHVSDLKSNQEHSSQDRLIYICAFKSQSSLHHPNNPFDYQWYRWDVSMGLDPTTVASAPSESRSSTEEDEDVSWQADEACTEANGPPVLWQADLDGLDFIEHWDSFGIAFHDNMLGNMLSIWLTEAFDEDQMYSTSLEVYLPLGSLTPEAYNVCTEYHYVESAINALTYIQLMPDYQETPNSQKLYSKTRELVIRCVDQMKKEKSRYFTTTSGSNSLALLASFEDGRDILFRIAQDEDIAINLFSYVRKNAATDSIYRTEDRSENALILLIKYQDFELYNLLLNRVLLHAQKLGAGCYSAVTDSLLYLQSRGDTDILKSTCQKLQFLHTEQYAQSIVLEEIDDELPSKTLHKNLKMEFTDLKPKSTNEQILKYGNSQKSRFLSYWRSSTRMARLRLKLGVLQARVWYANLRYDNSKDILRSLFKDKAPLSQTAVCVIPYVYFCSYDIYDEDAENIGNHWNGDDNTFYWNRLHSLNRVLKRRNKKNPTSNQPEDHLQQNLFWSSLQQLIDFFLSLLHEQVRKRLQSKITYKKESALIHLALNQHENDLFSQKDTILETLLYFKWKKQIKYRFLLVCFVHAVYYVSFSVGVLFANEVFDYTIGTTIVGNVKHTLTVTLMLVSCGLLWLQETRQFFKMGFACLKYFLSFYNWVDLIALTLPIVNLWQMLTDRPGLNELSAITTIVLWLHGVLRLRAIAFFGVTVETIIQLMKSVYKTLLIMLLVMFAFTNAFIVLLARKDDAYFQEKYSGAMVLNNTDSSTENTVNYNDDSSSNNFKNPFKAFSTLWFFVYGVWDPINDGDAGDDYMIMVLAILFSLLTVLLFFNLVIALMSSRAEEVKALGNSVWLSHFAEVIAEIEQLWCFKFERVSRENNPSFIYYLAKRTDIRKQADLLEEESNELVQKLQSRIEKKKKRKNQTS